LAKAISYLRSAATETSDQPPLIHPRTLQRRGSSITCSLSCRRFPPLQTSIAVVPSTFLQVAVRGSGPFLLVWGKGTLSFERIVVIFEKSVKVRTGGPKVGSQEAGWQSSDETET
jgi:hypothetical protein